MLGRIRLDVCACILHCVEIYGSMMSGSYSGCLVLILGYGDSVCVTLCIICACVCVCVCSIFLLLEVCSQALK